MAVGCAFANGALARTLFDEVLDDKETIAKLLSQIKKAIACNYGIDEEIECYYSLDDLLYDIPVDFGDPTDHRLCDIAEEGTTQL